MTLLSDRNVEHVEAEEIESIIYLLSIAMPRYALILLSASIHPVSV
jgi:hypothetical protein